MTSARLTALLGLAAAAIVLRADAYEVNAWPAVVLQRDSSGQEQSWSALGPCLFSEPSPEPDTGLATGFRPFYVVVSNDTSVKTDLLYPIFYYRRYSDSQEWSIFKLVNGGAVDAGAAKAAGPTDKNFDVWPFYFSREAKDPADSYHALLPFYGTMKGRLGFRRLSWVLFPGYVEVVNKDRHSTFTPFPFVKVVRGSATGFALWPLFGFTRGPGPAKDSYYLWPLIWNNTLAPKPDAPEGSAPGKQFGFIPFYTRDTAPGSINENYLWPFFGHTEVTAPYRYSEKRYFWPFLVQGRGDDRLVNRWGPFYAHSDAMGLDSKWVVWPLWHRQSWVDADTTQTKTRFFYFVYWSLEETSVSHPAYAHAYKRHFWPVLSIWDNGTGTRQLQFPSPLDVFFPNNPDMRVAWTPLFSIYRYDHRPSGETRSSLLWGALTWRRDPSRSLTEFHLGPLMGMHRRPEGQNWSLLGFDFGAKLGDDRQAKR